MLTEDISFGSTFGSCLFSLGCSFFNRVVFFISLYSLSIAKTQSYKLNYIVYTINITVDD